MRPHSRLRSRRTPEGEAAGVRAKVVRAGEVLAEEVEGKALTVVAGPQHQGQPARQRPRPLERHKRRLPPARFSRVPDFRTQRLRSKTIRR